MVSTVGSNSSNVAEKNPAVICLQESNFKEDHCPILTSYHSIFKNREKYRHASGGVVMFIKAMIFLNIIQLNTNLEAVAATIRCPNPLTISNIYLPNSTNIQKNDLLILIHQLPKPFILLGDFNSHNPLWGCESCDARGLIVEEVINSFDHINILNNGKHTHFNIANGNTSAIDLAMTTSDITLDFHWQVLDTLYDSDHYPIMISRTSETTYEELKQHPKWIFDIANWMLFENNIKNSLKQLSNPWSSPNTDINDVVMRFTNMIYSAASASIPMTSGTVKKKKLPWFNKNCAEKIKEYKKAFRKYKKETTVEQKIEYKKARAEARRMLKNRNRGKNLHLL